MLIQKLSQMKVSIGTKILVPTYHGDYSKLPMLLCEQVDGYENPLTLYSIYTMFVCFMYDSMKVLFSDVATLRKDRTLKES